MLMHQDQRETWPWARQVTLAHLIPIRPLSLRSKQAKRFVSILSRGAMDEVSTSFRWEEKRGLGVGGG
jgi:hypothetical protein